MRPKLGTVSIEAYKNRDGRFVARVTITDPTWEWIPYLIPPQLVGTTEPPRVRLDEVLKDAGKLAEEMAYTAVIQKMRSPNV
jgi:hypothetical protein